MLQLLSIITRKNDTLEKLAAGLYSEITVELAPSNLVKAFGFAEAAITALAIKPMPVLKCVEIPTHVPNNLS